ncbi:MAG: hypothetical protein ACP5H3_00220 [Candidatus Aenigmatarchaeota archaeon]
MGLLAQATMLEVITSLVLILAAFAIFFKYPSYKTEWQSATLSILVKDILSSLDFTGKLYNTSFYADYLTNFTSKTFLANESYIFSLITENTFKPNIIIAANCSSSQINEFIKWYNKLIVNKRKINIFFIEANLTNIPFYSDVLLICDYKNLTDYRQQLLDYISKGRGIVEISDISSLDSVTKEIFGIDLSSNVIGTSTIAQFTDVSIYKPIYATSSNYLPYKLFYNFPIVLNASSINSTTGNYIGNFTFRNFSVPFEINFTSKIVYFYNGTKFSVSERSSFYLYGYNFFLSYILDNTSIAISFKKNYNFTDFLGNNRVYPVDKDVSKIFLYEGYYSGTNYPVPLSTINSSKAAWIANFNRYNNATDDQKLALLALILTVSNKENIVFPMQKKSMVLPYINVESYDIYEPYLIYFGVSYPY